MAVLPLVRARRRLHLDATALVIGSMAPDFEYFARGHLSGGFTHSLLGWWVVCVPLTLVLAAAWQLRVGPLLQYAAPAFVRRRGFIAPGAGWWTSRARIAGGVASAAIGTATHLVWDSATHWSGWIVHHVPALVAPVDVPVLGVLPLHRVVQHVSSIVGLAAVIAAAVVAIRARPVQEPAEGASLLRDVGAAVARHIARGVLLAALVAGEVFAALRLVLFHRGDATAPDSITVAAISGALLGCLLAATIIKVRPS